MRKDTLTAAALEAGLLGLAALLGFLFHAPLIFASLGPTAYEQVETPTRPSARPYNVLVGHGIGIVSALVALGLSHAFAAPAVSMQGVPLLRVVAVLLAAFLTVVGTLLVKANQPASLSTTMLITLGTMDIERTVVCIVIGICLMVVVGEPIRRARARLVNARPLSHS